VLQVIDSTFDPSVFWAVFGLPEPFFRKLLVLRYHLAALKGDKEQMNQVVALTKGKHGAEHCVAHAEALTLALARAGRLQAARLSSNRAMDLALQEGQRETAASYRAARAVWEAVYGNAAEGKRALRENSEKWAIGVDFSVLLFPGFSMLSFSP
jgi:hypothetical protein